MFETALPDLTAFRSLEVACQSPLGAHRMACRVWGPEDARQTVVCVHGLSRNACDFDVLGAILAGEGLRLVAVDVVGRGASDWLEDGNLYGIPQYVADMERLLEGLGEGPVDWIGTSMGGMIGMALLAKGQRNIRSLLLNDVGPVIPAAAIAEIAGYVGADPSWSDRPSVESYFRENYGSRFGPLSDALWDHVAKQSVRRDGALYRLHYDPKIAAPFAQLAGSDVVLWPWWDAITCPVMVIRGANSPLLLAETAAEMRGRGPGCAVTEVPDVGHAPWLMDDHQVGLVRDWLAIQ